MARNPVSTNTRPQSQKKDPLAASTTLAEIVQSSDLSLKLREAFQQPRRNFGLPTPLEAQEAGSLLDLISEQHREIATVEREQAQVDRERVELERRQAKLTQRKAAANESLRWYEAQLAKLPQGTQEWVRSGRMLSQLATSLEARPVRALLRSAQGGAVEAGPIRKDEMAPFAQDHADVLEHVQEAQETQEAHKAQKAVADIPEPAAATEAPSGPLAFSSPPCASTATESSPSPVSPPASGLSKARKGRQREYDHEAIRAVAKSLMRSNSPPDSVLDLAMKTWSACKGRSVRVPKDTKDYRYLRHIVSPVFEESAESK
jgi:hypothetical protein